jgi:hypothetical protein
MKKTFILLTAMLVSFGSIAQQSIDLSTLWQRYAFYAGGISGLRSITRLKLKEPSRNTAT